MKCSICQVIDENILTFAMRGENPHVEFMRSFLLEKCRFCLSWKIRKGYASKLRRFKGRREEFKDDIMIRAIKVALYKESYFDECPYEYCSDEMEQGERFKRIPRKDRYLVTVSEHFETVIVTDDDELYEAVNSDDGLISRCKRSSEAIESISN